ncbi:MAG: hypothetical protein IKE69_13790 [Thermoguttaceae bacterium]|nr:hypothetical protein [Thermoguttaceae bacterium]
MVAKKSSAKPKAAAAPKNTPEKTAQKTAKTGDDAKSAGCGWSWRRFAVYGVIWLCLFYAVSGGCRAVRWVNGKRQLISLILNGDFGGWTLPVDPVLPKGDGDLAKWIMKNLPAEKAGERPAVAAVFSNVAGMLRRGELTGPRDAMAETVAQLQPVCTRRVWLGFFTKLGTALAARLKDASAEEVAETFETVSDAIAGSAKAPPDWLLDLDSIAPGGETEPGAEPEEKDGGPAEETVSDPNVEPEGETDRTAVGDCPAGSCPANTGGTRYGYGWYGRGWWY